jgi:integrase
MKGSVFQLPNGKWRGVVYTEKVGGKWKRKYFQGDTEKEVRRKVNDLIYELQHNIHADPGRITIEKFLNDWLEIYKNMIEENTAEYYRDMLDKHIIPGIGKILLRELKPADLDVFYSNLHNKPRKPRDPKPGEKKEKVVPLAWNSIRKINSIIHGALDYAMKNKMIMSNAADFVSLPKKEKYTPAIMEEENFKKLLDQIKGDFKEEIPILLAACTGLRRGEVFGLNWRDVNFKNNTISINRVVTRYRKYITKKTKNTSSQRFFAVPEFIMKILSDYRSTLKVVPEKVCTAYTAQSYSSHFKLLLEKFVLPHVRYHDLRHFNAIIMLKYGVKDKTASKRLGHASVKTTTDIYQHVLSSMDVEAAKILNDVFTKSDDDKNAESK